MKDPTSDYLSPRTPEGIRQRAIARMETLYRIARVGQPEPPEASSAWAESPPGIDPTTLPTLPDGEQWSPAKLQAVSEAAKELNITAEETHQWLAHFAQAVTKEPPTAEEGKKELRAAWGDRFQQGLRAAWLTFQRLPLGLQVEIEEQSLGNDPAVLKRLAALGQPMLQAEQQINAVLNNKAHAYWKGDARAIQEMNGWYKILKGATPTARVP